MLQTYVEKMALFANDNRHVHRELKEYTISAKMILSQFVSLKHKEKTTPAPDSRPVSIESFKEELTAEIKNLRELIVKQNKITCKITTQIESMQQQTSQQQQKPLQQNSNRRQENQQQKQQKQPQQKWQREAHQMNNQQQPQRQPQQPEPTDQAETEDEVWTTMTRKRDKKEAREKRVRNPIKRTADVIVVKVVANKNYASTLKDVRHGLVNAGLTDGIIQARKTLNGDLFLKLKGNVHIDQTKSVATDATGTDVFSPQNKEAVELRGLDGDIAKEALTEHLKTSIHPEICMKDVKALKTGYGGSVTGVVVLPTKIANKLATGPRLKIGWSHCRVHVRIPMVRCSRCLEFGHRKQS